MIGGEWDRGVAAAALESLANEFARDDVIGRALAKTAMPVAADMRAEAEGHRRPPAPDMADAIAVGVSEELSEPGNVCVKVGPRKAHKHGFLWRIYEWGTSKLAAWGIMRRVWDGHRPGFTERFVANITPAYVAAVQRARSKAANKAAATAFHRMKTASSKAEFLAAMKEWAP